MKESFFNQILSYYDLSLDEYRSLQEENDFSLFSFCFNNELFLKAKDIIKEAINSNTKILIYGDYDCDGILSTSILYNSLNLLGIKPGFYIPFRIKDGYGLNKEKAEFFYNLGYRLFILVDNGVTLIDEISYLKEKGARVIVIDHHQFDDKNIPEADVLIHWSKIDELKENNISAGALSFLFSVCLLDKIDEYLLSLGSITIISDLMPMINFNRKMVKLGLKTINQSNFKNIDSLINRIALTNINEENIAINFVPKINSIGRIVDDNSLFNIVRYFNLDEENKWGAIRIWIEEKNNLRKEILQQFDENDVIDFKIYKNIIFCFCEINEGLIGLIANRLLDKYKKNAVVLTTSKEGETLKGSVRTIKGTNAVELLNKIHDLLINFGGHEGACGFELYKVNYNSFKEELNKLTMNSQQEIVIKHLDILKEDVNQENYDLIESLRPFGKDFEYPNLLLRDIPTKEITFSKSKEHIYKRINEKAFIIYFNYPLDVMRYENVSFRGRINKNYFKNIVTYQFRCSDYLV